MGQIELGLFECCGWELDLAKRELRALGAPVPIGSRAFEILETLIVSAGEIVSKDELMKRVWPGLVVEDNTIQVHISAIRKALGKDRNLLKTISGRGYRILGDWTCHGEPATTRAPAPPMRLRSTESSFFTNIPASMSDLVGRQTTIAQVLNLISAYRVVTLTGPGGIGKTVLASEIARHLLPSLNGDAFFVELVSLSDPDLVPTTLAQTLDLHLQGDEISADLVARAIGARKMLLVIDNCEHVIDAAAAMVEAIVRACRNVSVLATSRELLRIEGEFAYRVPPLEVPASEDVGNALEHSAVQLFIARTRALLWDFAPSQEKLSAIAAICRHLDGIPLAIEFAAARAATLGIQQIAGRLDDRFVLLTGGRRTALPRHQTLRAALDWSYELLPETERQLLRNLAIFPAGFTLDAAVAVSGEAEAETALGISNLVSKSLVTFEGAETGPRWRLLETVRAYALEKLGDREHYQRTMRRLTKYFLSFFRPFSEERHLQAAIEEIGRYRREIDNVRAALRWALSPDGDGVLGARLAATTSDFWTAISLVSEAGDWAQKALEYIGEESGSRTEMVLRCALGFALIYTQGMSHRGREVLTGALQLAKEFDDFDYQQRVTCALWLFSARSMELEDALAFAREYEQVAKGRDLQSRATAAWLVGIPQTYQAEHQEAGERLEWAARHFPFDNRRKDMLRLGADVRTSSLAHNTVNLVSRGQLDTAVRTAEDSIREARETRQPFVLCVALAWAAAFVSLSLDEVHRAKEYGEELLDHAFQHGLRPFHAVGLCVTGSLASRAGKPRDGIDALRSGLGDMREAAYLLFYPFFLCELASAMQATGRFDEGLQEIENAFHFSKDKGYRWMVPEILRRKGEILAAQNTSDAFLVKNLFRQAMQQASAQGGIYWQIAAGNSLVEFLDGNGERGSARGILLPIYEQFTEGFSSAKLSRAKILIEGLG
ncbi:winged helix-turn-helix domain-containing protein [Rhizobium brockwellii]|uniref:Winged helix-turn-helix domain-containing protein n=1 Tax=Rhizobium brockwellii TaxID=3019932 RepID=A0ABU3YFP4_9HYPH|nr:winged helix-turn-helix domain-containing protein [Rhizobium brockwellii]MDV4159261.1 winged helix-turn-helix domain-containing protein [Rhizobium brockwellii]MDV4177666.1 winged helix-turn-helix domain-containing protein [Rhizobium brockwellii]MDV4184665.1 winged helix-turn-helix domain-containing protein [Rhizobium brockwellii]